MKRQVGGVPPSRGVRAGRGPLNQNPARFGALRRGSTRTKGGSGPCRAAGMAGGIRLTGGFGVTIVADRCSGTYDFGIESGSRPTLFRIGGFARMGRPTAMNTELLTYLDQIAREKGIDKSVLIEAVRGGILSASKKAVGPAEELRIDIDPKTGDIKAIATLQIVDFVHNRHGEMSLPEARRIRPDAEVGGTVEIEVTPANFGRIAAQAARQAIVQRIRQAERDIIYDEFKDQVGDILSGMVRRFDRSDVIIDIGRTEAVMPQRERVPTEEYQVGDRVRGFVTAVNNAAHGPEIVLSRSHPGFVRRLFELEVSEILEGTVEIKAIAREAGFRSKIAVSSNNPKVDPVGACVGMRGSRVKNIVRELNGEKIDIVRWDPDVQVFVENALSPARLKSVEVDETERRVRVLVDEEQLSLAIGRRGQNARLAAKLSGWRIDIEKEAGPQAAFEERLAHAIDLLAAIPGIERSEAELLVRAGFVSADGILAADVEDLTTVEAIDPAAAQRIMEAARADKERAEGTAPPGSEG